MNRGWEIELVFWNITKRLDGLEEEAILTGDELYELKTLDDRAWEASRQQELSQTDSEWESSWAKERDEEA